MSKKDDTHKDARVTLEWLMAHLEPAEGEGMAVKLTDWGMIELHEYALMRSLQPLLKVHTSDVQRLSFVRRGLQHLVRQEKATQTVDALVDHIQANYLRIGGSERFLVTAFLPKIFKATPEQLIVDGVVLKSVESLLVVRKYRALESVAGEVTLALEGTRWEHEFSFSGTTGFQYELVIPVARTNAELPINELCQPLEKLRSLLNFAATYGRITWRFSRYFVDPRSDVLPSPLYFVENQATSEVQILYEPLTIAANIKSHMSDDKIWERTQLLLEQLSRPPVAADSIVQLIWKLLELRQKGTDSIDAAVSLLHYWQVIERSASPIQKGRGIENSKTVAHLATLFPLSPTEKQMLLHLGEIRNQFAHVGEFPYEMGQRPEQIVKRYADECIRSLLFHWSEMLHTVHALDAYYTLATQPSSSRLESMRLALAALSSDATPGEEHPV